MDTNSLWTRRSNVGGSKLSLSMSGDNSSKSFGPPSASKSRGGDTSTRHFHSFTTASPLVVPSPTGASSAFGLGSGAFATFGSSLKTPKTPGEVSTPSLLRGGDGGAGTNLSKKPSLSSVSELPQSHPLKYTWVVWYRSPGSKFQDYEKSTVKVASFSTVEEFWAVYCHLRKPNALPHVSDYHFFKKGIRPVWEDDANKTGGKWILRLKKGVSTRFWEELLMAIIGEQFAEATEDLCGAVLSIRSNEDVLSVWTAREGATALKIKQTMMRKLNLPAETVMVFKSHAASIEAVNNKTTTSGAVGTTSTPTLGAAQ